MNQRPKCTNARAPRKATPPAKGLADESEPLQILIEADGGTLRFLHNDDLHELLGEGEASIERASNVEPDDCGGWSADMAPVDGPVLGSYPLRQQALNAEARWLHRHRL